LDVLLNFYEVTQPGNVELLETPGSLSQVRKVASLFPTEKHTRAAWFWSWLRQLARILTVTREFTHPT